MSSGGGNCRPEISVRHVATVPYLNPVICAISGSPRIGFNSSGSIPASFRLRLTYQLYDDCQYGFEYWECRDTNFCVALLAAGVCPPAAPFVALVGSGCLPTHPGLPGLVRSRSGCIGSWISCLSGRGGTRCHGRARRRRRAMLRRSAAGRARSAGGPRAQRPGPGARNPAASCCNTRPHLQGW